MNLRFNTTTRRGAILPLIAILLPVLLILSGFAINVAYMQLCQTELQISTDIAAKAAGRIYASTRDKSQALVVANEAGSLNLVAGDSLVFDDSDLKIGTSNMSGVDGRYGFTAAINQSDTSMMYNAIEISGGRTSLSGGEVATFFPTVVGTAAFAIQTTSVSTQVEVDVALVIDRSGSMAYAAGEPAVYPPIPAAAPYGWDFGDPAPSPSRWRDAVSSVQVFLDELATSPLNEQVALVTYADGARIDTDLTTNYSLIMDELNDHTDELDGGGTNISAGLQAGEAALASSKARDFSAKVVIILTDGKRSVGGDPMNWAKTLSKNGVMVVSITFSDEADQGVMKDIAAEASGFHVHANNKQDLRKAFGDVSKQLPNLLTR